jgi:hypothetical protein
MRDIGIFDVRTEVEASPAQRAAAAAAQRKTARVGYRPSQTPQIRECRSAEGRYMQPSLVCPCYYATEKVSEEL